MALSKVDRRTRIKKRIRKKISGDGNIPRLSVFRSNKQISVQIIDDSTGRTLVAASSLNKEIATKTDINNEDIESTKRSINLE